MNAEKTRPVDKKKAILEAARNTLLLESDAIRDLIPQIGEEFGRTVQLLQKCKGRLIITGIGKSANIAQKLVATMNSTGQPAVFMHAADAIHGDLGTIQKLDCVLCLSKSGDSPEIKVLVPLIRSMKNVLIAMVANRNSFLAKNCDFLLHTPVEREACPNNLAPTTSTACQLAMGDALAVALMEARGFSASDFARYHPGGALGKKLYLRIGDLLGDRSAPSVTPATPVREVLVAISAGRLGAVAVLDKGKLVGVITDGDIRRMLEKNADFRKRTAREIMNPKPRTIESTEMAVQGFQVMESSHITQLLVMRSGRYVGIVHLHDILKEGIF